MLSFYLPENCDGDKELNTNIKQKSACVYVRSNSTVNLMRKLLAHRHTHEMCMHIYMVVLLMMIGYIRQQGK